MNTCHGIRIILVVTCLLALRAAHAQSAAEILDAAGIHGGLVVHLGSGDGKLTAGLAHGDGYLVHGLDADARNVRRARRHVDSLGIDRNVSFERFDGKRLPYVDNLVNLVVGEELGDVSMDEVMRVLSPRGVAYIRQESGWAKTIKPWPQEIDEWTHFLHDASGNAVAADRRIGPPRRMQWTAGPKRARDHDSLASLSAMTSSGGRIFYIYDEGPTSLNHRPAKWRLVARDAFNGVLLWKRRIDSWVTHLYYFRSGPVQLPRRLVSIGDRVYATLGLESPVTALDAASGRTLLTFKGSERTEEILCHDGVLLAAIGDPAQFNREAEDAVGYWELAVDKKPDARKAIVAYDAKTGEILWKKSSENLAHLVPLSLAAAGDKAFFMDRDALHCVDLATGNSLWQTPCPTDGQFLRSYAPTLVVDRDAVLCLTLDRLAAFSLEDGKRLWEHKGYLGFGSPGDLFAIDGLAWTLPMTSGIASGNKRDNTGRITGGVRLPAENFLGEEGSQLWGIDILTGNVVRTFAKQDFLTSGHHHRCYRNKATERFLICSRRGLEFVDLEGDDHVHNWWIRGECQYGLMPANGFIYAPPDPCRCFNLIKVDGFCALAARNSLDTAELQESARLLKGPAYPEQQTRKAPARRQSGLQPDENRQTAGTARKAPEVAWSPPVYGANSGDWPTYRHDVTRSGSTGVTVSSALSEVWSTDLGGKLTSPVVAQNRLFVSRSDRQTVFCLDAQSGKLLWRFVAGGPVDSPPTLYDGLALFGCRDGRVYCLRAADGTLAWRFRAAPADRRIVADDRLESVWPVHGSVLVLDGVVYFAAGRSSFLDGGIRLFGLDAHSGQKVYETSVAALPSGPGREVPPEKMTGALPDVLVSDSRTINMRHVQFDRGLVQRDVAELTTLVAATGLLEDCWAHRLNWHLGQERSINSHANAGSLRSKGPVQRNPFGKLLVFDDRSAYGVQSPYTFLKHTKTMHPPTHDGHKHQKYSRYEADDFPLGTKVYALEGTAQKWARDVPLQVRAMVSAGTTLFLAGWRDSVGIEARTGVALDEDGIADRPAVLWALSSDDGSKLAQYDLTSPPAFDALIAAAGRLFVALEDGTILCLGPNE